jgi:peptidoglycan/xylan/chitin deacetylase (PgdA/CDA1 family)
MPADVFSTTLSLLIGRPSPAWQSLLDSEGVAWHASGYISRIAGKPVLLVPYGSSRQQHELAWQVLDQGGAVMAEPDAMPRAPAATTQRLEYPYHKDDIGLLSEANSKSAIAVVVEKVSNGTIMRLPFCFEDLWCDRTVKRRFVSIGNVSTMQIWENLPAIAKKNLRKIGMDVVWRAHQAAGLPLVQKWYWPKGSRSVFCFRADMDSGEETPMRRYLDAVKPWMRSLSLFVCGSSYAANDPLLKAVVDLGAEVGNHTYTHYVYPKKDHNQANLELTERLLAKAGIQPKGFVGPASFWRENMYDLLQEKGYEYASSFGLDHDNLPYFPLREDGSAYNLVEIPFHCLGDRFPNFGMQLDAPEVSRFFEQLIEKKYLTAEPMNIYGHPDKSGRLGDSPVLIDNICRKALSFDKVWTGSMRELSAWWHKRHSAKACFTYDMNARLLKSTDMSSCPDLYWSIRLTDGQRYVVAADCMRDGVNLERLESIAYLTLPNSDTNQKIGEVVHSHRADRGILHRIRDCRREFRRNRQKIVELDLAQKKGEVH